MENNDNLNDKQKNKSPKTKNNDLIIASALIIITILISSWFIFYQIEQKFLDVNEKLSKTESDISENRKSINQIIENVNKNTKEVSNSLNLLTTDLVNVKTNTNRNLNTLNTKISQQNTNLVNIQNQLGIQISQNQKQSRQLQEIEEKSEQERENIERVKLSTVVLNYATSICSGVIFKQTGNKVYVVTNSHCLNDSRTLTVLTIYEKSYNATIEKNRADVDLAIISFESNDNFIVAEYDSNLPQIGDSVVAIGTPSGLSYTTTKGIVSAIRQTSITGEINISVIQTDAPINSGNSGGGLFRLSDGKLVGINTFKISTTTEGLGFAISIKSFIEFLDP